jgi:histidine triad (HIT) family protein
MGDTIFDKILAGDAPADIVFEDEHVMAFRDINPQAPVHVIVIPKKGVEDFKALQESHPQDVGLFFQAVSRVASILKLDGEGYRIVLNCGKNGQQTVEYLHAHILGERQMSWPPG